MTDVGKDGEQDTMIFSELRVTKGLSRTQCQLEDSVQDEMTSKVPGASILHIECIMHIECSTFHSTIFQDLE